MNPKIYPKKIDGKIYYYYQYTRREKINSKDEGKGPGSGKSRVKTFSEYLGTAESIHKKINESKIKAGFARNRAPVGALYHRGESPPQVNLFSLKSTVTALL